MNKIYIFSGGEIAFSFEPSDADLRRLHTKLGAWKKRNSKKEKKYPKFQFSFNSSKKPTHE